VSWPLLIVGIVVGERLVELAIARRNTKALLAKGAIEYGAAHYPLFWLLHAAWLAAVFALAPRYEPPQWAWLALYLVLIAARIWVMASLGRFWTTRIIAVPGAPRVQRGPYRYLRHPNYLVVAGEIAVLPLVFGEAYVAAIFSALNLALLAGRIRIENRVLDVRRDSLRASATRGQP